MTQRSRTSAHTMTTSMTVTGVKSNNSDDVTMVTKSPYVSEGESRGWYTRTLTYRNTDLDLAKATKAYYSTGASRL